MEVITFLLMYDPAWLSSAIMQTLGAFCGIFVASLVSSWLLHLIEN